MNAPTPGMVSLRREPGGRVMLPCAGPMIVLIVTLGLPPARAQEPEARFDGWQKVEGATETRTYKEAMRNGGAFDASARTYLEQIAMPQLAAEGNRGVIAYVRRRIKEQLLTEFGNEKSADDANKTVTTFLEGVITKADEPPVVRINAMLMLGELSGPDRKPWAPAVATLARDAASTELPAGVRIAAVVGLSRHCDAAKGNAAVIGKLAQAVVPAIQSILGEPFTSQTAVESDWLVSRGLAILTQLGPATPETAAEIVRVMNDPSRSFDTRVRAAAALAVVAGKDAKVDGAAAIAAIDELAVAALRADLAIADRVRLERAFGGGGMIPGSAPPGMMPGMMPGMSPSGYPGLGPGGPGMDTIPGQPPAEQLIPREVCRRAAWRLVTLADAVLSADGQKGIGVLFGGDSGEAKALAGKLRRAAMDLDAYPDDVHVRQAVDDLRPPPPPSEEEQEDEPAQKEMTEGDKPDAAAPAAEDAPAQPAAGAAQPAAGAAQPAAGNAQPAAGNAKAAAKNAAPADKKQPPAAKAP